MLIKSDVVWGKDHEDSDLRAYIPWNLRSQLSFVNQFAPVDLTNHMTFRVLLSARHLQVHWAILGQTEFDDLRGCPPNQVITMADELGGRRGSDRKRFFQTADCFGKGNGRHDARRQWWLIAVPTPARVTARGPPVDPVLDLRRSAGTRRSAYREPHNVMDIRRPLA